MFNFWPFKQKQMPMLSKCEYVSTTDFDKYRKIHCKDVLATQYDESSLKRYMRRAKRMNHAAFFRKHMLSSSKKK